MKRNAWKFDSEIKLLIIFWSEGAEAEAEAIFENHLEAEAEVEGLMKKKLEVEAEVNL